MNKIYLNSAMKSTIITLGAYISFLEDLITVYEQTKKPTPLLKLLRSAKTWGRKALTLILESAHPDEVEKLVGKDRLTITDTGKGVINHYERAKGGEIAKMEVVVRYKDQAVREEQKMRALESITAVETDDLMTIFTLAVASCNLCDYRGDDVESCKYRKVLIKYDAEPINVNPGDGCPYRAG